jgi:hypothetical protein
MPIRRLPPPHFMDWIGLTDFFGLRFCRILLEMSFIGMYICEKLGLKLIWVEVKQASNVEINHQFFN